jgi:hypothetical protein
MWNTNNWELPGRRIPDTQTFLTSHSSLLYSKYFSFKKIHLPTAAAMVTVALAPEPSTSGRDHRDSKFAGDVAVYVRAYRPWHSLLGVRIVSAKDRQEVRVRI